MRNSLFIMVFLLAIGISNAQKNNPLPIKGETILPGEPSGMRYQHIDFLRKNIIIKRGAISDFLTLIGKRLIVESISQKDDGSFKVNLRRKDGLNFFRFYRVLLKRTLRRHWPKMNSSENHKRIIACFL